MKFTREAWENAPEGARLEWQHPSTGWKEVHFVGTTSTGSPVIEEGEGIGVVAACHLRIIPPKRKVTVQLWDPGNKEPLRASVDFPSISGWTLLGEHTFEIEGE